MHEVQEKALQRRWAAYKTRDACGKLGFETAYKIGFRVGFKLGLKEARIEQIHMLQSLLLVTPTPEDELSQKTLEQLKSFSIELLANFLNR